MAYAFKVQKLQIITEEHQYQLLDIVIAGTKSYEGDKNVTDKCHDYLQSDSKKLFYVW